MSINTFWIWQMSTYIIMTISENDAISDQSPLSPDQKWSEMNTKGGGVIMDFETWSSIPTLTDRIVIVISQNPIDGHYHCTTIHEAIQQLSRICSNIYIVGDIYRQALLMKMVDGLVITRIHQQIQNADYVTLPLYKTLQWTSKIQLTQQIPFHYELYKIARS